MEGGLGVARGASIGLWLGLLTDEALIRLDQDCYAASALYRSPEHNLGGLFPWERAALAATFPSGGRILVVGAGAGREAIALAGLGHQVVAGECHPQLRALAAELAAAHGGGRVTVVAVDRDAAPAVAGPVDGAILGWGLYSELRGRARRVALLRDVAGSLAPGAPLLFSFLGRPERSRPHRAAYLVARAVAPLLGRPRPEEGDYLLPQFGHFFTAAEVEAELAAAGLATRLCRMAPYPHAVAVVTR